MKKLIFLFILFFLLVGCSSSIDNNDINKDDSLDNTFESNENDNIIDDENSLIEEPNIVNPNLSFDTSDLPSVITPVEETVSKVYDSVVSIEVWSTSFSGSGSGVLFSEDKELGISYIITCFHVIEGASNIEVVLSNNVRYKAQLVGGYSDEDLAVLSIKETGLVYSKIFSNSDDLKLGSQVVCIGNPLGTLPGSVSSGYLSYKNRKIKVSDFKYMNLLQTDVAINSGNSGGGLFNTSGVLIGIVNAKYSDEAIEGLGFAIPSNTIIEVINNIVSTASYDIANNVWNQGYMKGDWELGFVISDGRISSGGFFGSYQHVVYISSVLTNNSLSGEDKLKVNDIIKEVKIDYYDFLKEDKTVDFSLAYDVLEFIYSSELILGDKIIFTVSRNSIDEIIEVELEQYIYSI